MKQPLDQMPQMFIRKDFQPRWRCVQIAGAMKKGIVTKLCQKILETEAHIQLEQFDTVYDYTFSEHGPMNGYICESKEEFKTTMLKVLGFWGSESETS